MKCVSTILPFLLSFLLVVDASACILQTSARVNIVPALRVDATLNSRPPAPGAETSSQWLAAGAPTGEAILGVVLSGPAHLNVNVRLEVVGSGGPAARTDRGRDWLHDEGGSLELEYLLEGASSAGGELLLRLEYE